MDKLSYMTRKGWDVAWEVYGLYDGPDRQDFARTMEAAARGVAVAGVPFNAYNIAHNVCRRLEKGESHV